MAMSFYILGKDVVMVNIHQMTFEKPIELGSVVKCTGRVVYAGQTSGMVYLKFEVDGEIHVEGFISYVNVDENGDATSHGIEVSLDDPEVAALNERAKAFLKK